MKLSIRLSGLKIVVVFVSFLSKLIPRRVMQTRKQRPTLILLFSRNIFYYLRNAFSNVELTKTDGVRDVKTFHKNFARFLKIAVFLQNTFNTSKEYDKCFNDDLLDFCKNHCADCSDFNKLKEVVSNIKVKNNRNGYIIVKFTLQIYAFVCQRSMDFPEGRFD